MLFEMKDVLGLRNDEPTQIDILRKLNYRDANAVNVTEENILDELLKLDAVTDDDLTDTNVRLTRKL
jgi:hypothetical protein